jgi:hypothetical protein
MEYLDLGGDLTYNERPIKILDTAERVTHSKIIKMCKVQWSHHAEDEATWEHEEGRDFFKGGRFVTSLFLQS